MNWNRFRTLQSVSRWTERMEEAESKLRSFRPVGLQANCKQGSCLICKAPKILYLAYHRLRPPPSRQATACCSKKKLFSGPKRLRLTFLPSRKFLGGKLWNPSFFQPQKSFLALVEKTCSSQPHPVTTFTLIFSSRCPFAHLHLETGGICR